MKKYLFFLTAIILSVIAISCDEKFTSTIVVENSSKAEKENYVAGKYPIYTKQDFLTGMGREADELIKETAVPDAAATRRPSDKISVPKSRTAQSTATPTKRRVDARTEQMNMENTPCQDGTIYDRGRRIMPVPGGAPSTGRYVQRLLQQQQITTAARIQIQALSSSKIRQRQLAIVCVPSFSFCRGSLHYQDMRRDGGG